MNAPDLTRSWSGLNFVKPLKKVSIKRVQHKQFTSEIGRFQ